MNTRTALLVIAAVILALVIVLFQYRSGFKESNNLYFPLALLRFIALFGVLVLLINPKFTKEEYNLEKTDLVLLSDNSMSVRASADTVLSVTKTISENKGISDKFRVMPFGFGTALAASDSLSFTETHTDIGKAIASLKDIYKGSDKNMVILLTTDGNQTKGEDYGYLLENDKVPIYPIVIGDTTRYEDLRIERANANTFAFLKNKYPIELYITYEGSRTVESTLNVSINGKKAHRENVEFTPLNNTKVITVLATAETVGAKTIEIEIDPLENERNRFNNKKSLGLEVIDEKTNVTIVSAKNHPDIGTLKKAIESNEQRSVSIRKPEVPINELDNTNVFILYEPNSSFLPIYKYIQQRKTNCFTVCGANTDWNFLNEIQANYSKDAYGEQEEILPVLNKGFGIFDISEFIVENLPPLEGELGEILISSPHEVVLGQNIKGVELDEPLLAVIFKDQAKEVVLFGENLWKWRMQSYRDNKNFQNFDGIIGKIILYLSSNTSRNRLDVDHDLIYQGSDGARISARYFDEAFEMDRNASLILKIQGKGNNLIKEIPMLLKDSFYEADLSDLPPGEYIFTVLVADENLSSSGSFTILDFNVEQQFLSSDYKKLNQLAVDSQGKLFFPSNIGALVKELMEDPRFSPVQKSKENVVSLIDFRILLMLIAAALSVEWFIRKYNGLI
ncbi:VWA domain-containing protein [Ulvibacterium sp.]|uniref:VWA domain-containing protein n=1 Tax=Ulvibacterium sp. TaxID=2665914 RepID=UPI00263382CD|nr:VWA domain-containing protein [Ulvibacterium sp.]